MDCPHCNIEMGVGQAINPMPDRTREGYRILAAFIPVFTAKTLKLEPVWKCANCGHSEIMKNDQTHPRD